MQSYDKYIMSTGTHYISNSGKDENGTYHGGTAGDQSGHEWELKAWYSRPWTVILRYPDINVGLLIARLGCAAALNNKIGYDQYQRTTYWKQLEAAGYDPGKITVACEEDCTAGVTANVKAAGYLMNIPSLKSLPTSVYSGSMRSTFVNAGFKALTASKYTGSPNYLLPGDILLYEGHHAATNVSYGSKVRPEKEAGSGEQGTEERGDGRHVAITGGSVNVRSAPGTEHKVLGVVHKHDELPYGGVSKEVDGRAWYLVAYENQNGWVSSKYAKLGE